MTLEPNTIVYYYIYGSVLAALSRPKDNRCGEALQVMQEVQEELDARPEAYADGRATILSIVEAAEEICSSLNADLEPTVTGTPPTPTGTPATTGTANPQATSAIATLVAQTTPSAPVTDATPTPAP
jgi:hypothetical protein